MGRSNMRALHMSIAVAALCTGSVRAEADEKTEPRAGGDLTLVRGEGAEQCPDGAELKRLAVSHGLSADPPKHVYRVTIARARGAYRAEIVDETAHRVRRLVDAAPRCAPLGEAIAVVLATMWGSEQIDEPQVTDPPAAEPPITPPPAIPVAPADVIPAQTDAPPPFLQISNDLGAGIAIGIVAPITPTVGGHIALELGHYSIAVGLFDTPFAGLDLPPGVIRVSLFSSDLRGCIRSGETTRIGLCPHLFLGDISAHSVGFDVNRGGTREWYAAGLELFVNGSLPVDWIHYRLGATVIVPLHAETFSIAGIGSAYETPPVGGMVMLSLELGSRLGSRARSSDR